MHGGYKANITGPHLVREPRAHFVAHGLWSAYLHWKSTLEAQHIKRPRSQPPSSLIRKRQAQKSNLFRSIQVCYVPQIWSTMHIPDSPQKKKMSQGGSQRSVPGGWYPHCSLTIGGWYPWSLSHNDLGGVDLHGCHLYQLFNQFLPKGLRARLGFKGPQPGEICQFPGSYWFSLIFPLRRAQTYPRILTISYPSMASWGYCFVQLSSTAWGLLDPHRRGI